MKDLGRTIFTVVLVIAVMAYTVYNYAMGKTDMTMFVVSMCILGLPLINMIRILIQQWKDSH